MASYLTEVHPLYYTSCYCEENIYCLLRDHLSPQQVVNSTVVYISGKTVDYVPFFCQKRASDQSAPVYWKDYHVILVSRICTEEKSSVVVFDLDSALAECRGSAVPFDVYIAMTLYNAGCTDPMARRLSAYRIREAPRSFRVIPAMEYLRNFASDRSHMRRKNSQEMDEWLSPPPPYPPIVNEMGHSNTFPYYLDFKSKDCEADPVFGRIIDQLAFLKKFGMSSDEGLTDGVSLAQSTHYEIRRLAPADTADEGKHEFKCLPELNLQNKPQTIPPERDD